MRRVFLEVLLPVVVLGLACVGAYWAGSLAHRQVEQREKVEVAFTSEAAQACRETCLPGVARWAWKDAGLGHWEMTCECQPLDSLGTTPKVRRAAP